jgi:hypothetical protein
LAIKNKGLPILKRFLEGGRGGGNGKKSPNLEREKKKVVKSPKLDENNVPKKILLCFMTCNQNLSKSSSSFFGKIFAKFEPGKYDFDPISPDFTRFLS